MKTKFNIIISSSRVLKHEVWQGYEASLDYEVFSKNKVKKNVNVAPKLRDPVAYP